MKKTKTILILLSALTLSFFACNNVEKTKSKTINHDLDSTIEKTCSEVH